MKYEKLARDIADALGGADNLRFANHCATRLRIKLKDPARMDGEKLGSIDGVLGVRDVGNGEVQVIVGTDCYTIYNDFIEVTGFTGETDDGLSDEEAIRRAEAVIADSGTSGALGRIKAAGRVIVDYLGGTVAPIIPMFMGCGMLMAFLTICINFFGLDANSGAVVILNGAANAGFYFMPIVLGWSAATKLNAEPVLGALLGMTLVYSTINGAEGLDFLGLPVYATTYNNTFLPIILGVPFLALVYRFFKGKIHSSLQYFLLPLVTMVISIPMTLLVLGPIGAVCGESLSVFFYWAADHFRLVTSALWSAFCPIGVITGMEKAVQAINIVNMQSTGFDNIFLPGALCGNSAVGGAALAVWFMSRNKKTKAIGASAGVTAILGITEPAPYGICIPFGKPLLGASLGAAIGGVFGALVDLKQFSWAGPGLMTCATYISPDGDMTNFFFCLATIAVAAIAGFAMTILVSSRTKKMYD